VSGIDSRSAAFLQEMGITPLWTPRGAGLAHEAAQETAHEPAAQPDRLQPPAVQTQAAPVPPPVAYSEAHFVPAPSANTPPPGYSAAHFVQPAQPSADSAWGEDPPAPPATDEEISRMDWAELKASIAACTRCGLCKAPRKPVYGSGAQQALWMVAAGASTAADEKERQPLAGEPGKLLANMLAAVDLARDGEGANVWVTNLIKCRPTSANGGDRAPTPEEAAACRPYLERELALTGAGMLLTLGQIAANALQDKALAAPLAGARGQVHQFKGARMVATLHPGELLRRGSDKALAWADLCLARAHDGRTG
jgi:DNA polymerase